MAHDVFISYSSKDKTIADAVLAKLEERGLRCWIASRDIIPGSNWGHAKSGYNYPTIRLPHTFSKLAGLPARIYQTVHKGALAFLVVVGPGGAAIEKSAQRSENACSCAKSSVLTWRRSPVRIRPSPSFFLKSATLEPSIEGFSDKIIMAKTALIADKKRYTRRSMSIAHMRHMIAST
jgi:TIR domain